MSEDYDETLDYSKIDESISTTRQLQFGARQEKTIVGNVSIILFKVKTRCMSLQLADVAEAYR